MKKLLTLALALAALAVFPGLGVAQEERKGVPEGPGEKALPQPRTNPCQPIVDASIRQAQARQKVDLGKLRKDLNECGQKNRIPIIAVERKPDGSLEDKTGRATVMTANAGGSILCVKYPQYFIFYLWGVFPSGGPKFHAASIQYETDLASSLSSFGPGIGFASSATGLVHNIPNMVVNPSIDPLLFVVLTAGFTIPSGISVNSNWSTGSTVFGVFSACVSIDRSP